MPRRRSAAGVTLRSRRVQLVVAMLGIGFAVAPVAAANDDVAAFGQVVRPFLHTYCVECHGPKKQQGERRFDRLTAEAADDDALVDMQDVLD